MNSELKAVIFSFFTTLGIFLVFVGSSVALTGQSDIRYRAEIVGSVIFVIGLFISIFTIEYSHNTRNTPIRKLFKDENINKEVKNGKNKK